MTYFYKQTEPHLFTVGFEDTSGKWHPTSDHSTRFEAEEKVAHLNGATMPPAGDYTNRADEERRERIATAMAVGLLAENAGYNSNSGSQWLEEDIATAALREEWIQQTGAEGDSISYRCAGCGGEWIDAPEEHATPDCLAREP